MFVLLRFALWGIANSKKPARGVCASADLFGILLCVLLLRQTGHSRRHAMRMVMVESVTVQQNAHGG
ncbi:MAG TPA: hypothetical protein VFC39_02735 [Acidobacteriaceae bacterium]|nr:hypothetical protein [Acidobacteriaceae bacterium]